MSLITNQKVAGMGPDWAGFRGFSMLFDNPGDCLTPRGAWLELNCRVDSDPQLGFFRCLRVSLDELDSAHLAEAYSFCPLPTASYHMAAWDGGNDANVANVTGQGSANIEGLLFGLPGSICHRHEFTEIPLDSVVNRRRDWNLELRFKGLLNFGGSCVVALLEPTDERRAEFDEFVEARAELSRSYRQAFGIGASEKFTPHVTLGYFANLDLGNAAAPLLPKWNEVFIKGLRDQTLSFQQASLYGFTGMATFFRAAE